MKVKEMKTNWNIIRHSEISRVSNSVASPYTLNLDSDFGKQAGEPL